MALTKITSKVLSNTAVTAPLGIANSSGANVFVIASDGGITMATSNSKFAVGGTSYNHPYAAANGQNITGLQLASNGTGTSVSTVTFYNSNTTGGGSYSGISSHTNLPGASDQRITGIFSNLEDTANTSAANGYMAFFTRSSADAGLVERMRISSKGYITSPYQPAFLAQAVAIDTSYSANTVLPWPNSLYNRGNCFSTSTNRFTAPVAGAYFFAFQVWHSTASTARVAIRVNGARIGVTEGQPIHARLGATATNDTSTLTAVLLLNANDYVDTFLYEGTVTLFYANHFTGYLIG